MAASPIDKIIQLLASDAVEKRIAAAIVLGELRAKGAHVVKALAAVLPDGGPTLQRHALDALTVVGASKALPQILPLLGARDAGVRGAAVNAAVSCGDGVLSQIEGRLAAAEGDERRSLDAVLARLGGKEAFTTLLAGLEDADEEEANAAAVAMRAQVRDADKNTRKSYHSQLEKVLAEHEKKKADASVAVVRAALKMLGYLEDPRALPTLQKYAAAEKQPAAVRQEALIALRFTHQGKQPDTKMINALIAAASAEDRTLAQTALITLAGLELPDKTAGRLDPLIAHADIERAKFVIDMLSHRKSADAAEQLVQVMVEHEPRRAKLAADALGQRKDAAPALLDALSSCRDRDRARAIAKVLHPWAQELTTAQQKKLLTTMCQRLEAGEQGWQSPFDIADAADPKAAAKALRALFDKLKRKKPPERATSVLRLLCKSDQATHDDRYQLASRLLATSHKETAPAARRGDDALREIERLLREGYDVVTALKRDRSVDLDALYYLGFHFIEEGYPAGEDLLNQVADKGGRKKIAKAAKNKLALAGRAA